MCRLYVCSLRPRRRLTALLLLLLLFFGPGASWCASSVPFFATSLLSVPAHVPCFLCHAYTQLLAQLTSSSSSTRACCILRRRTLATAPTAMGRSSSAASETSGGGLAGAAAVACDALTLTAGRAGLPGALPLPLAPAWTWPSMSTSTSTAPALELVPKPKSVLAHWFGSYGRNVGAGGNGGAWKRKGVLGPKR